jgi:hypothetical protein
MNDKHTLHSEQSIKPGERSIDKPELPKQGLLVRQFADTEAPPGSQLKVGRHRHFEVICDEPPHLGGNDEHPQPLTYICMGVGF